jgi:hypothetical protein
MLITLDGGTHDTPIAIPRRRLSEELQAPPSCYAGTPARCSPRDSHSAKKRQSAPRPPMRLQDSASREHASVETDPATLEEQQQLRADLARLVPVRVRAVVPPGAATFLLAVPKQQPCRHDSVKALMRQRGVDRIGDRAIRHEASLDLGASIRASRRLPAPPAACLMLTIASVLKDPVDRAIASATRQSRRERAARKPDATTLRRRSRWRTSGAGRVLGLPKRQRSCLHPGERLASTRLESDCRSLAKQNCRRIGWSV